MIFRWSAFGRQTLRSGPRYDVCVRPAAITSVGASFREHLFGSEQAIECRRKACVDGHLHNDLGNFFARETNIKARLDVDLELRGRIAHRCQSRDGGDLAGAQVEAGAAVDVAEGELEQVGREIGGNVGERGDDLLSGLAVDLSECPSSAFEPAFAAAVGEFRHRPVSSRPDRRSR